MDLLDQYDTLFVLYPAWNDRVPNIIYSFLDSYDFSGKKIITLAISDKGNIRQDFSGYLYDIQSGYTLLPQADRNTLIAWLNGLGL